ncbi:MAG: nucleotidyltransferase family protein [Methanoregulaceae archaeon]|nr:nucleotidyltransferase family protein [Methanoregulaceae archaeon]
MASRISAILLAAGMSRRLGRDKPLLLLNERPFVAHCLDALVRAGVNDPVVVAGRHNFEKVREAIRGYPARIIVNDIPGSDMADSVRIGLTMINPLTDATFVCPCDHPLVLPGTLVAMRIRFEQSPGTIVIPLFSGRKGHPTLFPTNILEEIRDLPTLRDVISRYPGSVDLFETPDEGTVLDIDTWEDYRLLQDRFAGRIPEGTTGPVPPAGSPEANR